MAPLARQLQAAGATALAVRVREPGASVDGPLTHSPTSARCQVTEAVVFSSLSSPSPSLAVEPVVSLDREAPFMSPVASAPSAAAKAMKVEARGDGTAYEGGGSGDHREAKELNDSGLASVVVDGDVASGIAGGGRATSVVSGCEGTGADPDGSPNFVRGAWGGAANSAVLPKISEPSLAPIERATRCAAAATNANATPASRGADAQAATTSALQTPLSPTRPLTWQPTRQIPLPKIEYPLETTATPTVAARRADIYIRQVNSKAAKVLLNAVNLSTANMRVDLAAFCARTNDTAARIQQLSTEVDTCANLTQHTLVAVRKIEAAVKLAMVDVVKKGACPPKESEET